MNSCGGQCLKRRLTDVLSRSMPRLDCPDGCKAGANPVVCLAPLPHRAAGKLSTRSDHIHCTGLLSRRCHRSPVPGGERRERACGLPAPGFPSPFSFFLFFWSIFCTFVVVPRCFLVLPGPQIPEEGCEWEGVWHPCFLHSGDCCQELRGMWAPQPVYSQKATRLGRSWRGKCTLHYSVSV